MQSPTVFTSVPSISPRRAATGASLNDSTTRPSGRPRCEQRITRAFSLRRYSIVGRTAWMRLSLRTRRLSLSRGTLKSTRTSTRRPLVSTSLSVCFIMATPRPQGIADVPVPMARTVGHVLLSHATNLGKRWKEPQKGAAASPTSGVAPPRTRRATPARDGGPAPAPARPGTSGPLSRDVAPPPR